MKNKCLICNGFTELLDVVDFNKNCGEEGGYFLELSGIPIYYSICTNCNFTSCESIYSWSEKDFIEKIYNDQYPEIDPDYKSARPLGNANLIKGMFSNCRQDIRHLDYGGGNGILSSNLNSSGWDSKSYDPFPENNLNLDNFGNFNLITAFEVFEHVPNPNQLMINLNQLIEEEGLIIFSTLLSDRFIQRKKE